MTMKVYEHEGFPNPARVRIAIAEKAVEDQIEFVAVDVMAGDHKKADFLKLNPSGTVPVLELEDGTTIAECTAITEYLDTLSGDISLTGRTPKERATIHMMQRRAEADLLDAVGAYFHNATPGLGAEIEGYQCSDWGYHQKSRAIKGMHYFNDVLSRQNYVAGDQFSMADITAFAGLAFADFAKVDVPAECTNLKAWRERVSQRPSIAA